MGIFGCAAVGRHGAQTAGDYEALHPHRKIAVGDRVRVSRRQEQVLPGPAGLNMR